MQNDDGLDIPDFLKRAPAPAPQWVRAAHRPENAWTETRKRRRSKKEEFEREVRRIADRRWRRWVPSAEMGLRRPRITTFRKLVREELRRRDARQAAR